MKWVMKFVQKQARESKSSVDSSTRDRFLYYDHNRYVDGFTILPHGTNKFLSPLRRLRRQRY